MHNLAYFIRWVMGFGFLARIGYLFFLELGDPSTNFWFKAIETFIIVAVGSFLLLQFIGDPDLSSAEKNKNK